MLGVYFTGTGNTKYCVEQFLKAYGEEYEAISIEDSQVLRKIKSNKEFVFAHPIYYSNLPRIVREFIISNKKLFHNKKIYIIVTMGLFSGDGAGCSGRLLKKYGAIITGGLQVKMPDCIGDVKTLKKSRNENKIIVKQAQKKVIKAAIQLKNGNPTQEGLNAFNHVAGLFGQRLWFYQSPIKYKDKLKIDTNKCIACGKCEKLCPMGNIELKNKVPQAKGNCTMCYRCISNCPKQAITLIGKQVCEQCKIEKYL